MRLPLIRIVCCATALAMHGIASAQPAGGSARKFEIADNSFLIEESFNQEPGVFQNIFTWTRSEGGDWIASFTQEWPLGTMRHQLSYTIPFSQTGGATGLDDVLVHYRFQLTTESATRPAISPRVSVVLPTASIESGAPGLQFNLPVSKQFGDFYVHANAGGQWLQDADATTLLGASGIWRVTPMFHLMLETVAALGDWTTISPGFRRGWNIGDRQIVVGAAVPITRSDLRSTAAFLTYFSYELPFGR